MPPPNFKYKSIPFDGKHIGVYAVYLKKEYLGEVDKRLKDWWGARHPKGYGAHGFVTRHRAAYWLMMRGDTKREHFA